MRINSIPMIHNNIALKQSFEARGYIGDQWYDDDEIGDSIEIDKNPFKLLNSDDEIKNIHENCLLKKATLYHFFNKSYDRFLDHSKDYPNNALTKKHINFLNKPDSAELIYGCLEKHLYSGIIKSKAKKYYSNYMDQDWFSKHFGSDNAIFQECCSAFQPLLRKYNDEKEAIKILDMKRAENKLNNKQLKEEKILKAKNIIIEEVFEQINLAKTNSLINPPKAVMLEDNDISVCNQLANWMINNANCNSISLSMPANAESKFIKNKIKSALEESKILFENNKIQSIIFIQDFENLILDSNSQIEKAYMKSLLQTVYEKYGATIVFTTDNSKKLDHIIIQPHRVKSIDVQTL